MTTACKATSWGAYSMSGLLHPFNEAVEQRRLFSSVKSRPPRRLYVRPLSTTSGFPRFDRSGKVRAVPMAPDVATALARLGRARALDVPRRPRVPRRTGTFIDASAKDRRFVAARAGLGRLRFQEWMSHADMTTTQRYSHFTPRHDDAKLVADAFAINAAGGRSAARSTASAAPDRRACADPPFPCATISDLDE